MSRTGVVALQRGCHYLSDDVPEESALMEVNKAAIVLR